MLRWSSSADGLPPASGGKEELRATLLKPYLLQLRDARGDAAVRTLLTTVGIPISANENEAGWITVAAALRALRGLATALGEEALESRGAWMCHPETLGAYVRMLRVASAPIDAYRYLTANASETTRVGSYELIDCKNGFAEIVYTPRSESDLQSDRLLCLARKSELIGVPRIWGLSDASVEDKACLSHGDDCCHYVVRWKTPPKRQLLGGAIAGGGICGGAVAVSGSPIGAAIGAGVGAALGAAIGALSRRIAEERALRAFEKNRIAALERGLELRGQFGDLAGDLIGVTLGGKYRILRRIGSGGIGAVYAAEHVNLGSKVAVKVLRGAAAADASEIARLRREAQVQVSIEHPNVVRTLDLDQMSDGSIYVVMELLQGYSLAERLKREGLIAPAFAIPVFIQVCRALSAAHKLGIIHRDLKPGNVFICDNNQIKVLDFGMSKFSEAETLTQEGYTLGTPEYMAPEQCVGAPVDSRTDLYAFGVLMYEALTGEIPIQGRNRRELLELHQRTMPESMLKRRPDLELPAELDRAILKCLAKRAAERPASARELQRILAAIPLDGLPLEYSSEVLRRHPVVGKRSTA